MDIVNYCVSRVNTGGNRIHHITNNSILSTLLLHKLHSLLVLENEYLLHIEYFCVLVCVCYCELY